ncbi:MAG: hypothetical protein LUQ11_10350 [Methylococcaceae bacterium]|nr:hypothetical protein [Methylococcaceae bacterium]
MNMLINQLMRSSNGHSYETAGIISAFFNDSHQARAYAQQIRSLVNAQVELDGSQLAARL